MRLAAWLVPVSVAVGATITPAQEPPVARPYASETAREIKALSSAEIDRYRNGHGMGFALAAELNHYPGPKHVLELAKELGVTTARLRDIEKVHARMHSETVRLGGRVVDEERALDRLFATGRIDPRALARSIREIARLQGEIRFAHLAAHLETRGLLTPAQIAEYDRLRGYGEDAPAHDPAKHPGH